MGGGEDFYLLHIIYKQRQSQRATVAPFIIYCLISNHLGAFSEEERIGHEGHVNHERDGGNEDDGEADGGPKDDVEVLDLEDGLLSVSIAGLALVVVVAAVVVVVVVAVLVLLHVLVLHVFEAAAVRGDLLGLGLGLRLVGGGNILFINDKVKEEGLAGLLALLLEGLDGGGDGGVDILGTDLVVDGNGQTLQTVVHGGGGLGLEGGGQVGSGADDVLGLGAGLLEKGGGVLPRQLERPNGLGIEEVGKVGHGTTGGQVHGASGKAEGNATVGPGEEVGDHGHARVLGGTTTVAAGHLVVGRVPEGGDAVDAGLFGAGGGPADDSALADLEDGDGGPSVGDGGQEGGGHAEGGERAHHGGRSSWRFFEPCKTAVDKNRLVVGGTSFRNSTYVLCCLLMLLRARCVLFFCSGRS